jgi:hypothetical protein
MIRRVHYFWHQFAGLNMLSVPSLYLAGKVRRRKWCWGKARGKWRVRAVPQRLRGFCLRIQQCRVSNPQSTLNAFICFGHICVVLNFSMLELKRSILLLVALYHSGLRILTPFCRDKGRSIM